WTETQGRQLAGRPQCVGSIRDSSHDPLTCERQIAQPFARGACNCVRQGGSCRSLCRFSDTEERISRTLDHMHFNLIGNGVEPENGIRRPVCARDPGVVEANALVEGPAHGLEYAALDLIGNSIGIDDLAGIDCGNYAQYTRASGVARHLYLHADCTVRRKIFVAREGEPLPAPRRQLGHAPPVKALGCLDYDLAGALIVEMFEAKLNRVDIGRLRELVHEAFNRKYVHVSA